MTFPSSEPESSRSLVELNARELIRAVWKTNRDCVTSFVVMSILSYRGQHALKQRMERSTHRRIFPLPSPTAKVFPSSAKHKHEIADRFFSITPTLFSPSNENRRTFPSSAPTATICDLSETAMAVGVMLRGTKLMTVRSVELMEDRVLLVRR